MKSPKTSPKPKKRPWSDSDAGPVARGNAAAAREAQERKSMGMPTGAAPKASPKPTKRPAR